MIHIPSPEAFRLYGPTGRPWCGTVGDEDAPEDAPMFWGGPPDPNGPTTIVYGATENRPPPGAAREKWARQALLDGWQKVHPGTTPSLPEVQAIQGWSRVESGYGGWGNHPRCGNNGVGSNNWGSVQVAKLPKDGVCPVPNAFLCSDYDAKSDKTYAVCFYTYPTPADGAAAVIKHMTSLRPKTWAAIKTGNAEAIATAMYDEHYYGGFGPTREARIEGGVKALTAATAKIAAALEEEQVVRRGGGAAQGGSSADEEPSSSGLVTFGLLACAAVVGGIWIARSSR